MSTLPSTTIPVAKDCVLEMEEIEISEIVELFNNDRVHVVDIHVSFSNTSHDKELSDFHVKLLNPVGREILYSLKRFGFITWTLSAGIRNFKLHVNESQNDCTERQKNVTDFAFENMQKIVRSVNLATNYEVWYSFKETSSVKVHEICCQITKHNLPKCNHGCSKGNSFLYASEAPWDVIFVMMFVFALFYLSWLLHVFLSRTQFDFGYPKYYKLEESRMSLSFILFKIVFEKNGRVVSFIRSCALVGVVSYFSYLIFREIAKVFILILSVFWALSFVISYPCRPKTTNFLNILREIKEHRKELSLTAISTGNFLFPLGAEFAVLIKILTLPFNGRYWKKIIKTFYTISASFIERVRMKFRHPVLKILVLWTCYVLALLINALSVFIVFLCLIMLSFSISFMQLSVMIILIYTLEYELPDSRCPGFFNVLAAFHITCLEGFFILTVIAMASAIQSFLLGLFLNLIYFIPYFAFFSVLTFYCGNFWKTMEEKYLVLKRLIYEACRDMEHVNNGCIPNRHSKREEKVLPVVSKELYDKIREKLLPYDTNLFYFALKIFWAFAFSFAILKLIEMLNEFNVTGVVQVITTASLGVMPHIFNMIALKTSEEKKKAREEKLKLNVKYMVEDLLREDPELARTVLIIQQSNYATTKTEDSEDPELTRLLQEVYGTTTYENVQNSEHPSDDYPEPTRRLLEINHTTADEIVHDSGHIEDRSAGLNLPDNDNVEDPGLARTALITEGIDTAADEIVHDSENVQGTSDLNPPDRDDVEEFPIVIIHAPPKNDTTADENVQDSEHTETRSDLNSPDNGDIEEFPIVIVHAQENNDTTADENVQDSERAQAGSGLNPQNLRDNCEENVQDYELVEVRCDNGGENGRVKEENIQYESSM